MLPHDLPEPPVQKERRQKVVYLSHRRVFDVLTSHRLHVRCLNVPTPIGLPDGYQVVGAFLAPEHGGFAFIVEHESFDPVPDCIRLPEIQLQWQDVQIAR